MNHASCPDCRLRFSPAAAAFLPACPECGGGLHPLGGLHEAVGFRLFEANDDLQPLPEAIAVAMPVETPLHER